MGRGTTQRVVEGTHYASRANPFATGTSVDAETPNRMAVITRLPIGEQTYLYASRWLDPELAAQMERASEVRYAWA